MDSLTFLGHSVVLVVMYVAGEF